MEGKMQSANGTYPTGTAVDNDQFHRSALRVGDLCKEDMPAFFNPSDLCRIDAEEATQTLAGVINAEYRLTGTVLVGMAFGTVSAKGSSASRPHTSSHTGAVGAAAFAVLVSAVIRPLRRSRNGKRQQ